MKQVIDQLICIAFTQLSPKASVEPNATIANALGTCAGCHDYVSASTSILSNEQLIKTTRVHSIPGKTATMKNLRPQAAALLNGAMVWINATGCTSR